jgi:hypothetical protein
MPLNLSRKKADEMNSRTDPILMAQTQYARPRNQSPQYISKLAKAGVLPVWPKKPSRRAPTLLGDSGRR